MTNVLNLTTVDLKLAYNGTLETSRTDQYQYMIDSAVTKMKNHGFQRGWDLMTGINGNHIDRDLVRQTILEAVCRVLRNEDGYASESEDGYSYQLNQSVASGELRIFPSELDLIFPTITPSRRRAVSHRTNYGSWGPH